jgi:ankyrin repeat protein
VFIRSLAEEYGWTPLYLACSMGNLDMVSLLLESGANIETGNPVSQISRSDHLPYSIVGGDRVHSNMLMVTQIVLVY